MARKTDPQKHPDTGKPAGYVADTGDKEIVCDFFKPEILLTTEDIAQRMVETFIRRGYFSMVRDDDDYQLVIVPPDLEISTDYSKRRLREAIELVHKAVGTVFAHSDRNLPQAQQRVDMDFDREDGEYFSLIFSSEFESGKDITDILRANKQAIFREIRFEQGMQHSNVSTEYEGRA